MTTDNVQYLVAALARDARINKHVTPHGLRHSAITIGQFGRRRVARLAVPAAVKTPGGR